MIFLTLVCEQDGCWFGKGVWRQIEIETGPNGIIPVSSYRCACSPQLEMRLVMINGVMVS